MTARISIMLLFVVTGYAQQQVDIPWPSLADSPWPMILHDAQNTGRSPFAGPKTPAIKWTLDLPYGVLSGPIIGNDGTLYTGTNSYLGFYGDSTNYFYAIRQDGIVKWTYTTKTPYANNSGCLITNSNEIIFGSQSGWLYDLDSNGSLKWSYNTGSNVFQEVMNIDLQGNIYMTNDSGYIFSFSKDGVLNWKKKYDSGFSARSVSVSPDGNSIYIPGTDSNFYALNLDGNIKWIFRCSERKIPLLIDNSGNIYMLPGNENKSLVCIDSTGVIKWEYIINNNSNCFFTDCSPTMDYNGNIYFTYGVDSGGTAYYARIESVDYYGNFRWTYQFEQPNEDIYVPLKCDKDGNIYCGSTWGYYYYAISSEGQLLWEIPLNGYMVDNSGAIDSNGTLYIGTHLGSLNIQGEKTLIAVKDTGTVSIKDDKYMPNQFTLSQNYPNPFNSSTIIKYTVPQDEKVKLSVYDILGIEIKILKNETENKGNHEIIFNANKLSSGVYFYRIQAGKYSAIKKMILLK